MGTYFQISLMIYFFDSWDILKCVTEFSNIWRFSRWCSIDFEFNSVVVGEHILNDGPDFPGNIMVTNDTF